MLFYNMDFHFAHFAHLNFSHIKIEESFGLIWVKLQNGWFDLQISISGIFKYGLYFCSFYEWRKF